jgi:hypothetical protein
MKDKQVLPTPACILPIFGYKINTFRAIAF